MDKIIITGDQVEFLPMFKGAIVGVRPILINGSGQTTINGKNVCIAGDEEDVKVPGCSYEAGTFSGGSGTITIKEFGNKQLTENSTSGSKKMILKGSEFPVEFSVDVKGTNPSNGATDTTSTYEGKGYFLSTNTKIKAD